MLTLLLTFLFTLLFTLLLTCLLTCLLTRLLTCSCLRDRHRDGFGIGLGSVWDRIGVCLGSVWYRTGVPSTPPHPSLMLILLLTLLFTSRRVMPLQFAYCKLFHRHLLVLGLAPPSFLVAMARISKKPAASLKKRSAKKPAASVLKRPAPQMLFHLQLSPHRQSDPKPILVTVSWGRFGGYMPAYHQPIKTYICILMYVII